jgi:hypothetical protein
MKKTERKTPDQIKAAKAQRVTTDFPKKTLEEALRVPRAIEDANGGQPLPPTETAIALEISPGSSDLRELLSSSFKYGLTRGSYKNERVSLEELGAKIVRPTSSEEAGSALIAAALKPETFRSIYGYFRGKKLPEASFFQNTVVREFQIPREHAERCVAIFLANVEYVGLVRTASTGKWLSTDAVPGRAVDLNEHEEEESSGQGDSADGSTALSPVAAKQSDPPDLGVPNAIFLGHGKNKEPLNQLKGILDQYRIPYKVAVEEANEFRPISQKVADIMKSCGAAILVFTSDEEFHDASGNIVWRPSENVVYELGAASVLYGKRIIIFKEKDVHFPANFRDIGYIEFDRSALAAKTNELFKELIAFQLIKVTVGS